MLVELRLVEQRYQAVNEVLEGVTVTQVALRYGVTRQTVHRWLRRYGSDGLPGLADHSSRPVTCPHQMPGKIEARLITLRSEHPDWGPLTLGYELAEEGLSPVPSRSAIHRCLLRHGLITHEPRKRKRADYRRWERSRAMELWQMDIMGGVYLTDGTELKLVTGIDDHSRFCVSAKLVPRPTARPVCEALAEAMRRYGVPEQILTDNGKVFTGRFGLTQGEVLFERILRENGIRHLLTAPRSPTTTGKVERFHKTLRRGALKGQSFATLAEAQAAIDRWVERYNHRRPHQSLGQVPPVRRFCLAVPAVLETQAATRLPEQTKPAAPPGRTVTRTVGTNGRIGLATHGYAVGTYLAGETVDVVLRDDRLLEIFHRGVLIAAHAQRQPKTTRVIPSHSPVKPKATARPSSVDAVLRMVDSTGQLSFAGTAYRVGKVFAGQQVEVRPTEDTVAIYLDGECLCTRPARHDPAKLHGALAFPGGRPRQVESG